MDRQKKTTKKCLELQLQCIIAMEHAQDAIVSSLKGLQASTAAMKQLLQTQLEDDSNDEQ